MEKEKWIKIPELGIEVQKDVIHKGKSWRELKLTERTNELLTPEQCTWLGNSKYAKTLKLDGSSKKDNFFIWQPFKLNRKEDWFAMLYADSVFPMLYCAEYWFDFDPTVGVRFVRKIKK